MKLSELTDKYTSLSIIGMCKNAGKTTVLNYLIRSYGTDKVLGLTSVGRDGESIDLVTRTQKPEIYLYKNTLAATASTLLQFCTASPEILLNSGMRTPLGEVVVFKAKHGGFAELAGPSDIKGLIAIRNLLFSLGAEKVIIDGAISRKSPGSSKIAEAIIFSAGAAHSKNINTVVGDACFACEIFLLPEAMGISKKITDLNKNAAFDENGTVFTFNLENLKDIIQNEHISYIFLSGALTDTVLLTLMEFPLKLEHKIFVIEDSSKMLASREIYQGFYNRHGRLKVLKSINLAAVTINPTSPYGYSFDAKEFIEKMQEALPVPVFNVIEPV